MNKKNPDTKDCRTTVALGEGELRGVGVEDCIGMKLGSDITTDAMASFEVIPIASIVVTAPFMIMRLVVG